MASSQPIASCTHRAGIIRFHAGPPYEDIAFKIVNREWLRQKKHGFKCIFDRGILAVWFTFAGFRYRK